MQGRGVPCPCIFPFSPLLISFLLFMPFTNYALATIVAR